MEKYSSSAHAVRAVPRPRTATGPFVDRWLVTLALLAVALACAVVFLVATGVLAGSEVVPDEALRDHLLGFAQGRYRVAAAVGSLALGFGSTLLALRRHTGAPNGPSAHILVSDERGHVVVHAPAIASLAETAVLRTPGVLSAQVRVEGHGVGPVRLRVLVQVLGGTELPRTGDEVREAARHAVEQLAGLDVHGVVVRIDVLRPDEVEVD
jgi:uncharacterized alkaline shock family protein YloU